MDILAIASFVVGILGVVVALYQGFEKKKLDQFVKNQAWHNYSLVLRSWGTQQSAFKKYKTIHEDNINLEVYESMTQADTFLHSLHLESIRQIQLSERNFDINTVNLWQYIGRISESQAKAFKETAPFNPPGLIGSFQLHIHRYLQEKISKYQANLTNNKKPSEIE